MMLTLLYDAEKPTAALGSIASQEHHAYVWPIIDLNVIMTRMAVCSQCSPNEKTSLSVGLLPEGFKIQTATAGVGNVTPLKPSLV